jgi:hypothetical protein
MPNAGVVVVVVVAVGDGVSAVVIGGTRKGNP